MSFPYLLGSQLSEYPVIGVESRIYALETSTFLNHMLDQQIIDFQGETKEKIGRKGEDLNV